MSYNNRAGLIAMSVIFEVLAVGAVSLRFMSRRKTRVGIRADDWLVLGALLLGTGLCVIEIYGVATNAMGSPYGTNYESNLARWRTSYTLQWIYLFFNTIGVTLIKLSTVFLYKRLFSTKLFSIISWVWIGVLIAWGISFAFFVIFQCGSHVSAYFGSYEGVEKYCYKHDTGSIALVYSDVITDAITLFMPLPMVLRLQTSLARKLAIIGVFAIGLFTVAASATRTGIFISSMKKRQDALMLLTKLSVWNYLEVMVGICATCAITFRPVFADLNLSQYMSSLSSLRDGLLSSMFSRRESIDSKVSNGSDDVRNADEKLASDATTQSRRSEAEAPRFNEKVDATDSQGHIHVERSYNISLRDHDDAASHAETARGNSFC